LKQQTVDGLFVVNGERSGATACVCLARGETERGCEHVAGVYELADEFRFLFYPLVDWKLAAFGDLFLDRGLDVDGKAGGLGHCVEAESVQTTLGGQCEAASGAFLIDFTCIGALIGIVSF
jgi:hypothetical protein